MKVVLRNRANKAGYLLRTKIFPFLLFHDSQTKIICRRFFKPILNILLFASLFFVCKYIDECVIRPFCEEDLPQFVRFMRLYRVHLFAAFSVLVVFSHSVFASARGELVEKSYKGLKHKNLLRWQPPDTTHVLVGLASILVMLLCLLMNLYITFIIFFLTNYIYLLKDYIWLVRINSERSKENTLDFVFRLRVKPENIAKRAAKYPLFFIDMLRDADESVSFNYMLENRHFNWKKEQLNTFVFLCLSYYEVFWRKSERDEKHTRRFLNTFQKLLEDYELFIEDFNEKTWRNLCKWVRRLENEFSDNLYNSEEYFNIAEELREDIRALCLKKAFIPRRKIICAMQLHSQTS